MAGRPEIRRAGPDDVERLFDIRTSVRENHFSRDDLAVLDITPATVLARLRAGQPAWIAWRDGAAAGFAWADPETCSLWALFVRPEWEGQGIGRRLLAEAEAFLAGHGCGEAWLLTGADPALRARGFYRHLGWREDGTMEDGQLRMAKPLSPP